MTLRQGKGWKADLRLVDLGQSIDYELVRLGDDCWFLPPSELLQLGQR